MSINEVQSVKLKQETIEFENYFKQIPLPFKICADFKCNLESTEVYENSYTNKYHDHVPCRFAYKIVCVDNRFSRQVVVYRDENVAYEFIKATLKECKHCKKVVNKHFEKNVIMSEEKEQSFQQSNSCWICKKRIDQNNENIRDHCHITGKFRDAAHKICSINFQLNKNVSVIFHNLRGYDSNLIFSELNKFDVKVNVIPNGLGKYMVFFLSRNLVFNDSMHFLNSSLHIKNKLDEGT